MLELTPDKQRRGLLNFTGLIAAATAIVIALPALLAYFGTSRSSEYLGFQYNTDDHMVYAAWMRQAMDGRFLMDNRFTTDPQPGLTVNLYFFAIGLLAKVTGIPLAAHIARVLLSVLFIGLLSRLIRRVEVPIYTHKLALSLAIIGGGFGFLVWHNFGQAIILSTPSMLASPMLGRLPTDVWQPEGFVLPSMLTNSLFMASLCLISFILVGLLDSQGSWKPVLPAAGAMGVLMNIHSYDVLMIAFTMVGFLTMALARGQATLPWIARAAAIGAGAIPSALWFLHVLREDPVFQARAATETYSPNFRQVLFGYLPMVLLAFLAMGLRTKTNPERTRHLAGLGVIAAVFLALFALAPSHQEGYFLSYGGWALAFVAALAGLYLISDNRPAWNLLASWAVLGIVCLYFPALFQRKLAMGLSVPWCLLAALGVQKVLANQERSARNLVTVLVLVILGATSIRWFSREILLARSNVSNTTVHPVYLSPDALRIRNYLNTKPGRKILVAPPGQPSPLVDRETNKAIPDEWATPLIPDLNPILSGLTGVYSFAGHWSETPEYLNRRGLVERLYFVEGPIEEKQAFLEGIGADFVVVPVREAFDGFDLPDLSGIGTVVVEGSQFQLHRIDKG